MKITLKLYASLTQYLPKNAKNHATQLQISDTDNIFTILNRFNVPTSSIHLVLLNGIYLNLDERNDPRLQDGDILAIWPPIAGG